MCSDTNCWGIPAPPCADRWCTDICPKEAKHTDTIFNVVRQNRQHPRERVYIIRDRERKQYKYMIHGGGGSLHSNSTPSSFAALAAAAMAARLAAIAALHFLSILFTFSHLSFSFCSHIMPLFIGISWQLFHLFCCQTWLQG